MSEASFFLSLIAVGLSATSIYFQFFHFPRRVRLISMPVGFEQRIRVGVCNASKETLYVNGMAVAYEIGLPQGGTMGHSAGNITGPTAIVRSGEIAEFGCLTAELPANLLEQAEETKLEDGSIGKAVEIRLNIQISFPDGTIKSRSIVIGQSGKSASSSFFSIEDLNLDLVADSSRS